MKKYLIFALILLSVHDVHAQTNTSLELQRRQLSITRERQQESSERARRQQSTTFDRRRAQLPVTREKQQEAQTNNRVQQGRAFDQRRAILPEIRDRQIESAENSRSRQNQTFDQNRENLDDIRQGRINSQQNSREALNRSLERNRTVNIPSTINNAPEPTANTNNNTGNVRYIIRQRPATSQPLPNDPASVRERNQAAIAKAKEDLRDTSSQLRVDQTRFIVVREQLDQTKERLEDVKRKLRGQ